MNHALKKKEQQFSDEIFPPENVRLSTTNDLVDDLNQRRNSSDSLERENYLDGSFEKIQEFQQKHLKVNTNEDEEEDEKFDICPENKEIGFGQSNNASPPQNTLEYQLKRIVADRMTPEFKFSEELCRVDENMGQRRFRDSDSKFEDLITSNEKDRVRAFDLEKIAFERKESLSEKLQIID